MTTTTFYALSDGLYLAQHSVPRKSATVLAPSPTHHIAVLDCSGSMTGVLPSMRSQLKSKLTMMLREDDRLSIVWFSGKGECGVLISATPVPKLTDLQRVHDLIDRWLKPIGMTGFVGPLKLAEDLIANSAGKGMPASLFFMSDGYDNQHPKPEIMAMVEKLAGSLAAATVVEFGMYADHGMLTAMAERFGGTLVGAEDFESYAPTLERALSHRSVSAKRVAVPLHPEMPVVGNVAFTLVNGEVRTYDATGGLAVHEDVSEVWFITSRALSPASNEKMNIFRALYAAMAVFGNRLRSDVVWPLLKRTGDVRFINSYAQCFGKQRYAEFVAEATAAAFDSDKCLMEGFDPSRVPPEDAFTVIDLLNALQEDESARVLLDHSAFKYNRIGRKALDANEHLTVAERIELALLQEKLQGETNGVKLQEITKAIVALTEGKRAGLKFLPDAAPDGYPIENLVLNEGRPNVSVLVTKPGSIDLSSSNEKMDDNENKKTNLALPSSIATKIMRSYTIVKDGLVHVDELPVKIAASTLNEMVKKGLGTHAYSGGSEAAGPVLVFNLRKLPILTRKRVSAVSADAFFRDHIALLKAQAAQKVFNSYAKEKLVARRSDGLADKYGADVASWLAERGVTDNGFAPKSTAAPVRDVYFGKELKVSIKGFSSLPSLKDLRAKLVVKDGKVSLAGKPLNGPMTMMLPHFEEVEAFLATKPVARQMADGKTDLLEAWLDEQKKEARTQCRRKIRALAETTFAIVVGQVWFHEFPDLENSSMKVEVDGVVYECKVEQVEIKVEI